jgi:hypothetical protein
MKAEDGRMKDESLSLCFDLCSFLSPTLFEQIELKEPRTKHKAQAFILHPSAFILPPSSFNLRQLSPQSKMPGQNDESDRPSIFVSQELRFDHAP